MTHELKTHTEPFLALAIGQKLFEVREDDRNFQVGDELLLREYNPARETYTTREITRVVSYKVPGGQWGLPDNLCVLGLQFPRELVARNCTRIFTDALQQWTEVQKHEGREVFADHLSVDLRKSSLFERLIEGKRVFSIPPPCSFSYPWYSLLEETGPQSCEFWIAGTESEPLVSGTPIINQSASWLIEEKRSESEYIVSFKSLRCRVTHARPKEQIFEWDIEVLDLGDYAPTHCEEKP